MPPPDAKAINALGRRLGRHDPPLADDVVLLGEVEARYVPALEAVSAVVRNLLGDPPSFEGVQLTVASRPLKTVDTIIEKLRRERTRLSTMRDIAGIRIVGENGLTRSQQDRLANRIAAQFPSSATTVDRRATPTHGYKALHLVVEVEGYPVDQVRTDLQHAWADGMERFGDIWGRQIRYGQPPNASTAGELARRTQIIEDWKAWASAVEAFEIAWGILEAATEERDLLNAAASRGEEVPRAELDVGEERVRSAHAETRELFNAVRVELDRIRGML